MGYSIPDNNEFIFIDKETNIEELKNNRNIIGICK